MSIETQPRPHKTLDISPPSLRPDTTEHQQKSESLRARMARFFIAKSHEPTYEELLQADIESQTQPETDEHIRAKLIEAMRAVMEKESENDRKNDQEHRSRKYHDAQTVAHLLEAERDPYRIRIGIRRRLAATVFDFENILNPAESNKLP